MARVNGEDEEKKEEEGGRLKGDNQLIKRINIVFSEKHHSEFLCLKQPIILSIILPKDMKGISYKLNSFLRVKIQELKCIKYNIFVKHILFWGKSFCHLVKKSTAFLRCAEVLRARWGAGPLKQGRTS